MQALLARTEKEIKAWEPALRSALEALSPAVRSAWAAACLEHVQHVWWQRAENKAGFLRALTLSWNIAKGKPVTDEEKAELRLILDEEVGAEDGDYSCATSVFVLASAAEDAIGVSRIEDLIYVAAKTRNAVQSFAQAVDDKYPLSEPEALAEEFEWQRRALEAAKSGDERYVRDRFSALLDEEPKWRTRQEDA